MYLVLIAWFYVALMMAVAEATNSNGSLLGALITFILYGMVPMGIIAYLMGRPARRKAREKRERQHAAEHALMSSAQPHRGSHPAADPVAPMREEP